MMYKIRTDIESNQQIIKSFAYKLKDFKTTILKPSDLEIEIRIRNKEAKALDKCRDTVNSYRLLLLLVSIYHNISPFATADKPGLMAYLQWLYTQDKDEYLKWLHTKLTSINQVIKHYVPITLAYKAKIKIPTRKLNEARLINFASQDITYFTNILSELTDKYVIKNKLLPTTKLTQYIESNKINEENVHQAFPTHLFENYECLFEVNKSTDYWTSLENVTFDINHRYNLKEYYPKYLKGFIKEEYQDLIIEEEVI